ncbi:MAG TPA: thioredoxin [Bacteroidetes bacterium]|nr:thioredoxin [Bacteroidota bacterium]
MSYDVSDFQKQVIDRSFSVPVLVDFWAEWCGPCKVLGPILERLAAQNQGRWELTKLNTEEHTEIASKYQIQSIPNVKLFVDGSVVDQFVGALPEYQIQAWLQKAVPGKNRKLIEQAEAFIVAGDEKTAREMLEKLPPTDPDYTLVRVLHARTLLFDNPAEAAAIVADMDEPKHAERLDTIRTIAHLREAALHPERLPDGESRALYFSAVQSLFARDFGAALGKFIQLIRQDRYFDDDGSRKACIAIFRVLGEEHTLTRQYRREFSSALY